MLLLQLYKTTSTTKQKTPHFYIYGSKKNDKNNNNYKCKNSVQTLIPYQTTSFVRRTNTNVIYIRNDKKIRKKSQKA